MKHEKAVLVGLAYIIGFTTAFIGFGIGDGKHSMKKHRSYGVETETTSYFDALEYEVEQSASLTNAYVTEDGLFVEVEGESFAVSAKNENEEIMRAGHHYDVPVAVVSPSSRFVHFCEQLREVPTECNHFVYIVGEHMVKRVTNDGVQLSSAIAAVVAGWTDEDILSLEGKRSVSTATPWLLK